MRRLLNDIESRADAKVWESRTDMEAAIEEQDHTEEEANALGWRRAREIEELKIKTRKVERSLQRTEEDKELEYGQRGWKQRRDKTRSERSAQELKDVHQAMTQLRRSGEETSNRLEKLRKAGKVLT
jgi:uncharacterized protein YecT (DUF1311 family)